MRKSHRELLRLAREEGLSRPRLVSGGVHMHLVGFADGKEVQLPVSLTKAFATPRSAAATRLNIRRAIEESR